LLFVYINIFRLADYLEICCGFYPLVLIAVIKLLSLLAAGKGQNRKEQKLLSSLIQVPHSGLSNHTRVAAFHRKLKTQLQGYEFDALVGFNKIPNMDMYYCGDYCFVGRAIQKYSWLYRKTPRFLFFRSFERGVFSAKSHTKILSLSEREKSIYQEYYLTQDERFFDIPPTLDSNRRSVLKELPERDIIRSDLGVGESEFLVLLVGSGFKTKGLDRALRSIASLPDEIRVKKLMKAADLLLHPAYAETTGTVLLEAITYGLPVLATKVCGYAPHIDKATAGMVLRSPFRQEELNEKLLFMLTSPERHAWSENGLAYGDDDSLYQMPEHVSKVIEGVAEQQTPRLKSIDDSSDLFYLDKEFSDSFSKQMTFSDLMQLDGEVYREAPGRRTIKFESGGKSYFIKTHTGVGWQEIFKNLSYLRAPVVGAMNEWHGVHRLTDLEIDTMTVVGYGLRGRNPAQRLSFIITEALPTSISLEDHTQSWKGGYKKTQEDIRFKHRVIKEIAETSRTMHENGANHRDYYLCHFLMDLPEGDLDRIRLYLIDLHRMQLRRKTPLRWKVKDIAGLYFSSMDIGLTQRDLFRFMRAYRGLSLRETLKETSFWLSVTKRAKALYRSEKSSKLKLARDVSRSKA